MFLSQPSSEPRERRGHARGACRHGAAAFLAIALCLPAAGLSAEGAPDAPDTTAQAARFDAHTRTLRATGSALIHREDPRAMPQAFQLAENEARRSAVDQLTQYVYALETATGTVAARVDQDPRTKILVDSYIQGATLLEKRYLPGSRLEVDVELNLKGLDTILTP